MIDLHPCTCHISELRCKCDKCVLLVNSRGKFKNEISRLITLEFINLQRLGFDKKKCIRSFRRELKHTNEIGCDIFDHVASKLWKDE